MKSKLLTTLLLLIVLPLLILSLLWLWNVVGQAWSWMGQMLLLISTAFPVIYVIYLIWGYRNNRLLFSVGTGEVVAICNGSPETGEITRYYITEGDHALLMIKRNEIHEKIKKLKKGAQKTRAVHDLLEVFDKFMESKVKIAGSGFLGWILRPFNLFFMSLWNPRVTLHRVDQGKAMDENGEPITHFQWIDSPNELVPGVDVSGSHGHGTFPISIRIQIGDLFFWNFNKIFAQEESTAEQKTDQMRAAANMLCRGRTSDEIELRRFPAQAYTDVYLDLLSFGMFGGAVRITDFSLEGVEEVRRAQEELALAGTRARTLTTTAQGIADAKVIESQGEATSIENIGSAKAKAAHEMAQKISGLHVDAQRLVLAPNNPLAAIPTGGEYYAIGADAKAPEPYVDVTQPANPNSNP